MVNTGFLACVFTDIPALDVESSSFIRYVASAAITVALIDMGRPNLLRHVLVFLFRAIPIVRTQLLFVAGINIDVVDVVTRSHKVTSTLTIFLRQ
jgi:hypothetical protein